MLCPLSEKPPSSSSPSGRFGSGSVPWLTWWVHPSLFAYGECRDGTSAGNHSPTIQQGKFFQQKICRRTSILHRMNKIKVKTLRKIKVLMYLPNIRYIIQSPLKQKSYFWAVFLFMNPLWLLYAVGFLEQEHSLRVTLPHLQHEDNMTRLMFRCPLKSSSMYQLQDTFTPAISVTSKMCLFVGFVEGETNCFRWNQRLPIFRFLLEPFGSGGFKSKEKLQLKNGCGWNLVLSSTSRV